MLAWKNGLEREENCTNNWDSKFQISNLKVKGGWSYIYIYIYPRVDEANCREYKLNNKIYSFLWV
jgi:hypothetical protein